MRWNLNETTTYHQVRAGELDQGPLPTAEVAGVANRFGVKRSRFWSKPTPCVGWLLLNSAEGIFRDNLRLRRAVAWAVDRTEYAAQAGPYAASPWTRLFPPGFPGLRRAPAPYAETPRIAKARTLAKGHFRNGKIVLAYLSNSSANTAQAEVVRRALVRLGFKAADITMKGFSGAYFVFPPQHGWDLAASSGWCADYPDPRQFFTPLLGDGLPLQRLIVSPAYRRKIAAASRLVGNARLRAFGRLEQDVDENLVPVVPMRTYNSWSLFSNHVEPRSLSYQAVYSAWSIPALALK